MRTYHEWQKINPSKASLLAACASAIRQVVPEAEVILYGSVARGEERPDSDVDLLVLVPQEVTYELGRAISDRIYDVEIEREQFVSLNVRRKQAWHAAPLRYTSLYDSIAREGVPI